MYCTVTIHPVYVISDLFDWVTKSLIPTILGIGHEDPHGRLCYKLAKVW